MPVTIDTHWRYRGLQALVLENRYLRVTVLPELGGKVWDLIYKPADRNMLWHHPRVEPGLVAFGASYDDNWAGGWDELFPNDEAVTYQGESYPDHGEMWCRPWEWEVSRGAGEVTATLWRDGTVTSARMEKRITLRDGERALRFSHRLTNRGGADMDFLWKLHPALNVTEAGRIDIPLGRTLVPAGYRGRLGEGVAEFRWPLVQDAQGRTVDMRRTPPASARTLDFLYGVELADGWCALTDTEARLGFGLAFPREVFSTVWVFASYGGWRDLHTVVLEPCTGYPLRLDEAVASGRFTRLAAGASLEAEVTAVVYEGLAAVGRITPDGEVSPAEE